MDKELKKLGELVQKDPKLQEKLKKIKSPDEFIDAYLEIAKTHKLNVSRKTVETELSSMNKKVSELNMNELNSIAGGSGQGCFSGTWCGH